MGGADQIGRLLRAYYEPLVTRPLAPPYDDIHYRLGLDTLLVVSDEGTVIYMRPCR